MIYFFTEDTQPPNIDKRNIKAWIKDLIRSNNKKTGDINIIFCSDSYLLSINREYLNHDYFTDIITFNYNENLTINGDIFISLDTIKVNSTHYHVTFNHELLRVIIHGILHLLGFDDHTPAEKKEMSLQENKALQSYFS